MHLRQLRSGTCLIYVEHCGVTEKGEQIAMMAQLEDLVLGKPSDNSDESAAKTEAAYEAIFKNMKNLKERDMRLTDLQKLNFGKY